MSRGQRLSSPITTQNLRERLLSIGGSYPSDVGSEQGMAVLGFNRVSFLRQRISGMPYS